MTEFDAPKTALSLRKNFSWTFAGNVIYSLSQWGVLVLLAKLLTPEAVGVFTLALAITTPIIMFTSLGLRQAQATDVRHEYRFADYFGLRTLSGVIALLVIAGAAAFAGFGTETAIVIVLVGVAKVIEAQSKLFYGLFQLSERMDFVAKSMVIRGPVSLAAIAIALYASGQLIVAVVVQAIVWLCVFVLYDLQIGRRLVATDDDRAAETDGWRAVRPRWAHKTLASLCWLVLPLGFVGLLGSLHMNAPRYIIAEQLGLEQLGFFGAIIYILVAGNYVVQALGQSAVSRLARYYAGTERTRFVVLLAKMAGVGALLGAAGVVVSAIGGRTILTVLYTPAYAGYADLFVLIMAAALLRFVASMLQYGITAARRFRINLVNQIVVTITAFAASYVLVLEHGMIGAGYATIVTAAVYLLGAMIINIWLVRGMTPGTDS